MDLVLLWKHVVQGAQHVFTNGLKLSRPLPMERVESQTRIGEMARDEEASGMETKANSSIDPIMAATMSQVRVRSPHTSGDTISFARVKALNEALRLTPRVRPEYVAQARQFIGQTDYPRNELIHGIASLLAMNLENLSPEQE